MRHYGYYGILQEYEDVSHKTFTWALQTRIFIVEHFAGAISRSRLVSHVIQVCTMFFWRLTMLTITCRTTPRGYWSYDNMTTLLRQLQQRYNIQNPEQWYETNTKKKWYRT
jgi:hypothetical protein